MNKQYEQELTIALQGRGLFRRQITIATLVSMGLSNEEIANQLFINQRQVKYALTQIYKHIGIRSRAQLIVWCLASTMTHKYKQMVVA